MFHHSVWPSLYFMLPRKQTGGGGGESRCGVSVELHFVNVPSPWVKSEQMRLQSDRRTDLGRNNDLINPINSNNRSHEMLKVQWYICTNAIYVDYNAFKQLLSGFFFSNRMVKRNEQCFCASFFTPHDYLQRLSSPGDLWFYWDFLSFHFNNRIVIPQQKYILSNELDEWAANVQLNRLQYRCRSVDVILPGSTVKLLPHFNWQLH